MMNREKPTAVAGVLMPPPLIYAIPLVAGLLIDRWVTLPFLPPPLIRPLTVLFGLVGLAVLPALMRFIRAGTSPEPWKPSTALVTGGIYRVTRNPMYLGFAGVYLSVTAASNSLWPVLFLPLVLWVMHWGVIRREERYLETLFGDEYRAYRSRVRRWI